MSLTMERTIDEATLLRLQVENLLIREADLLDSWKLDEWLTLYTEDAHYYVPPSDVDGDTASPDTSLFYVIDDRNRMEERVIRLKSQGAHSEWPRSKVRHMVGNVIAHRDDGIIRAKASFMASRAKDITHDIFVGHYLYEIVERDGELKIQKKTCVLDMEALRPHARISIIL
ncbi:MAG: aromatic-ring-hydroxylating dioxygenase subunit beta [Novosphingobium sp.]|uniref:aromatic-ring-hydroxylating dioxygenase subunit beta n=1 Tax=Tsuneonella sp. CC-YZS046 TaxID=3042152 RepID=UPI002D77761E|nr:aromatic-ring-hydroxylating dioxygenase subunit beta [Tsuneonella sp. CC-YZS046]WRO67261.1 aromatic-ring-hydroxylating dioxygenase subunit beta [Tsuneonella sp. CC-YZS046]